MINLLLYNVVCRNATCKQGERDLFLTHFVLNYNTITDFSIDITLFTSFSIHEFRFVWVRFITVKTKLKNVQMTLLF